MHNHPDGWKEGNHPEVGRFPHAGCEIRVYYKEDAENPREMSESMWKLISWHRDSIFGDENKTGVFSDWSPDELMAGYREADPSCLIVPLYYYDYGSSGAKVERKDAIPRRAKITPETFTDDRYGSRYNWPNGMAILSHEKFCEEYNCTRITTKNRNRALQYLDSEIAELNSWINGEVYGYQIRDAEGEIVGGCWGFYGEWSWDYMLDEAKSEAEGIRKNDADAAMSAAGDVPMPRKLAEVRL